MKTLWIAALTGLPLIAGTASAQYGRYPVPNWGPGYRGNISPYLNIFRGTNTGIDYYLGTRSEQQRRANAQEFRDDLDSLPARNRVLGEELSETAPGKPIPSGAYSVFNNTGGYFNNTAGAFAYPNQQLSPSGIRPGTQASPSRRAGAAPRSGTSPGFPSRPAGR